MSPRRETSTYPRQWPSFISRTVTEALPIVDNTDAPRIGQFDGFFTAGDESVRVISKNEWLKIRDDFSWHRLEDGTINLKTVKCVTVRQNSDGTYMLIFDDNILLEDVDEHLKRDEASALSNGKWKRLGLTVPRTSQGTSDTIYDARISTTSDDHLYSIPEETVVQKHHRRQCLLGVYRKRAIETAKRELWAHLWRRKIDQVKRLPRTRAKQAMQCRLTTDSAAVVEFCDFKLEGSMARWLAGKSITTPRPIQKVSMRSIFEGESLILHAQTGEGKTLAYLLPLLLAQHQKNIDSEVKRVMVVTPTQELAIQISSEIIGLCGSDDAVELVIDETDHVNRGAPSISEICPKPEFLVGSAVSIQKWLEGSGVDKKQKVLKSVRCIVLDEIDTLLKPLGSYAPKFATDKRHKHPRAAWLITREILKAGKQDGEEEPLQFIGSSATVGRSLCREVSSLLGVGSFRHGPPIRRGDVRLRGTRFVSIPKQVRHFVVETTDSSLASKVRLLKGLFRRLRPHFAWLFVTPHQSLLELQSLCYKAGLSNIMPLQTALGLPGDVSRDPAERISPHDVMQSYDVLRAMQEVSPDAADEKEKVKNVQPIVASSMASARGLHLDNVDFVFLLGRPKNVDEYQHLAGRTGRDGKPGVVVTLGHLAEIRAVTRWSSMLSITFEALGAAKSAVASLSPLEKICPDLRAEDRARTRKLNESHTLFRGILSKHLKQSSQ